MPVEQVFDSGMKAKAVLISVLLLAGCAGAADSGSETYRAGYSDGCESAGSPAALPARRNDNLYKNDADYRAGWSAGRATCGVAGS